MSKKRKLFTKNKKEQNQPTAEILPPAVPNESLIPLDLGNLEELGEIEFDEDKPIYKQVNPLEFLLYDNTQVSNISINNIKNSEVQVFLENEIEPRTIKLPKPIAHLLRMAYREGLNDAKQNGSSEGSKPIISFPNSIKSQSDNQIIAAAIEMAKFLEKLGNCHGKTELNLIEKAKEYKLAEAQKRKIN